MRRRIVRLGALLGLCACARGTTDRSTDSPPDDTATDEPTCLGDTRVTEIERVACTGEFAEVVAAVYDEAVVVPLADGADLAEARVLNVGDAARDALGLPDAWHTVEVLAMPVSVCDLGVEPVIGNALVLKDATSNLFFVEVVQEAATCDPLCTARVPYAVVAPRPADLPEQPLGACWREEHRCPAD